MEAGMGDDYCYCPSYQETGVHGLHPKCKNCRYYSGYTII